MKYIQTERERENYELFKNVNFVGSDVSIVCLQNYYAYIVLAL